MCQIEGRFSCSFFFVRIYLTTLQWTSHHLEPFCTPVRWPTWVWNRLIWLESLAAHVTPTESGDGLLGNGLTVAPVRVLLCHVRPVSCQCVLWCPAQDQDWLGLRSWPGLCPATRNWSPVLCGAAVELTTCTAVLITICTAVMITICTAVLITTCTAVLVTTCTAVLKQHVLQY